MPKVTVTRVEGNLSGLIDRMGRPLSKGIPIHAYNRRETPIRTGRLQRSMSVRGGVRRFVVWWRTPYAAKVARSNGFARRIARLIVARIKQVRYTGVK